MACRQRLSVEEILQQVIIDDLYFQATGGGICFGGGEPLLRSDVIADFCRRCPPEWNIYLETSLNVPLSRLQQVVTYVDHYYVDVKDLSPDIYRSYCQADNAQVILTSAILTGQGLQPKVTIRLPLIPGCHNTDDDRQRSRSQLEERVYRLRRVHLPDAKIGLHSSVIYLSRSVPEPSLPVSLV